MCIPDIMFHNGLKENNMKLIRDLGIKLTPNGKRKRTFGLYQCPTCHNEFELEKGREGEQCYSCSRGHNKTHGLAGTRQYNIWNKIIQRTTNPNNKNYEQYKDKTPPSKWFTFNGFWEDMKSGYADNLSIDRRDNSKPYSKGNCRWTTNAVQAQNVALLQSNNTTGYRGIRQAKSGKWVARINHNGKLVHIGTFETKELGAKAYDDYVVKNALLQPLNFKRSA